MASEATPRINAKYLESFTNQIVRILGKVVSLRGESATVEANGPIHIHLNRVCSINSLIYARTEIHLCFSHICQLVPETGED